MTRKMYKRLTQPVFDAAGNVAHQPGELIAADAPLDPAARYDLVEIGEPDPEPAPEPEAAAPARHATVKPEPAAGKGAAHK